jgi:hypothetical protein
MCGIAGWISYDRDLRSFWVDRHVGFGHRRLAVIDIEGGLQPMQCPVAAGVVAPISTPSSIDVAELIDRNPMGAFQIKIVALCGLVALLDGFDLLAIGVAAPTMARSLQADDVCAAVWRSRRRISCTRVECFRGSP